MLLQEGQRRLVERRYVFIRRRMRAVFEDVKLGPADRSLQRLRESHRGDCVVTTECELRRCANAAELGRDIVTEHCVTLLHERVDSLSRTAAYELCKRCDEIRLLYVQVRSQAPRQDALDDSVGH